MHAKGVHVLTVPLSLQFTFTTFMKTRKKTIKNIRMCTMIKIVEQMLGQVLSVSGNLASAACILQTLLTG